MCLPRHDVGKYLEKYLRVIELIVFFICLHNSMSVFPTKLRLEHIDLKGFLNAQNYIYMNKIPILVYFQK